MEKIHVVECPRDAMQGWPHYIPTAQKINYINTLLRAGFDTIDVGSFVSAKAIPQMADTKEVLGGIDMNSSISKLLCIVANQQGGEDAVLFDGVSFLGFPFSLSETFQQRNTNASMNTAIRRVEALQELCLQHRKKLVVYLSMGFGNPYGDPYNADLVMEYISRFGEMNIEIISIADTVGLATASDITSLLNKVLPAFPFIEIGVHLHSDPLSQDVKIEAALEAGCRRFDSAIRGIGGCPLSGSELVGNIDTERMINFMNQKEYRTGVNDNQLAMASRLAGEVFK